MDTFQVLASHLHDDHQRKLPIEEIIIQSEFTNEFNEFLASLCVTSIQIDRFGAWKYILIINIAYIKSRHFDELRISPNNLSYIVGVVQSTDLRLTDSQSISSFFFSRVWMASITIIYLPIRRGSFQLLLVK
jgi:hypothetical protein